uniref:Uncharacterized protein n=1 Tax=Setaria italica TaxID=4555 RepID=K3ZZ08_SETIT
MNYLLDPPLGISFGGLIICEQKLGHLRIGSPVAASWFGFIPIHTVAYLLGFI